MVDTRAHLEATDPRPPLVVLGIGNLLMGDEGVGVHAVRLLEPLAEQLGADVVDGGTGGFHLLDLFCEYPHMILIDATLDDQNPGEVKVIEPRYATDYPSSLSAHDIGLKDLIESAQALGANPKVYLITISIAVIQNMVMDLSPKVQAALEPIRAQVLDLAQKVHHKVAAAAG